MPDELTERHLECRREAQHVDQADITLSALYVAYVGAMNPRQISQRFLADASPLSDLSHGGAERFLNLSLHMAGKLASAQTMGLQAISGVGKGPNRSPARELDESLEGTGFDHDPRVTGPRP